VCRRFEKYVIKGSKYAHWIGLFLSFHLNWILGPFVHGRLQNLQTCKGTFAHVITPLSSTSWRQIIMCISNFLSFLFNSGEESRGATEN